MIVSSFKVEWTEANFSSERVRSPEVNWGIECKADIPRKAASFTGLVAELFTCGGLAAADSPLYLNELVFSWKERIVFRFLSTYGI